MNLLVYIIVLAVICIASFVGFFILAKKNKILSYKWLVIYYLSVAIFISACGYIGLLRSITHSFLFFILLQVFFLSIGFLISYLWRRKSVAVLQEIDNSSRASGVLFVLINAVLGTIGFSLVFNHCDPGGLAPYYALAVIPIVLPEFISTSFHLYKEIPQEIYKVWYFPMHADDIDFDKIDTSTIYMLEVEYSKSISDSRLMNSKLRAPVGMKFGDWFRSFVEDYNYRYDSDPIHYLNEDQTPAGWIFYAKPSFFGTAKYIDPDKTITENKLVEKRAIIAKRVGFIEESE